MISDILRTSPRFSPSFSDISDVLSITFRTVPAYLHIIYILGTCRLLQIEKRTPLPLRFHCVTVSASWSVSAALPLAVLCFSLPRNTFYYLSFYPKHLSRPRSVPTNYSKSHTVVSVPRQPLSGCCRQASPQRIILEPTARVLGSRHRDPLNHPSINSPPFNQLPTLPKRVRDVLESSEFVFCASLCLCEFVLCVASEFCLSLRFSCVLPPCLCCPLPPCASSCVYLLPAFAPCPFKFSVPSWLSFAFESLPKFFATPSLLFSPSRSLCFASKTLFTSDLSPI